jgi:hypothetical protein
MPRGGFANDNTVSDKRNPFPPSDNPHLLNHKATPQNRSLFLLYGNHIRDNDNSTLGSDNRIPDNSNQIPCYFWSLRPVEGTSSASRY